MVTASFFNKMFTKVGYSQARQMVIDNYPYLVHNTSKYSLRNIKNEGLKPNPVTYTQDADYKLIKKSFGGYIPPILCLSFLNSGIQGSHLDEGIQLAVHTSDLPQDIRLGIDWSFSGTWDLVPIKIREFWHEHEKEPTLLEIYLKIFAHQKCIVSYDKISPELLHVQLNNSPEDDPAGWPKLMTIPETYF